MVRTRVLFGALMIAGLIGLVWFDERLATASLADWPAKGARLLRGGLVVTAFVASLGLFATIELGRLLRSAGHAPSVTWACLCNVMLIVIPLLASSGAVSGLPAELSFEYRITVPWLVASVLGAFFFIMTRKRTDGAAAAVATTILMIAYIGFLSSFVVRLRVWGGSAWLVLYFLAACKLCDIGAYFTGMAIGRHKLIPWLSPKKTWEGLFGGIAAAVGIAVLLAWLGTRYGPDAWQDFLPPWQRAAMFGVIMAVAGQFGDLAESLLKRDVGAKDSGAVVPAFGGLLDIIDSPLVCAPLAFALLVQS